MTTNSDRDDDLRELFEVLRDEEAGSAPGFRELRSAPLPTPTGRRRGSLGLLAAATSVVVLFGLLVLVAQDLVATRNDEPSPTSTKVTTPSPPLTSRNAPAVQPEAEEVVEARVEDESSRLETATVSKRAPTPRSTLAVRVDVVDAADRSPLPGVHVALQHAQGSTAALAMTDVDGRAVFDAVKPGESYVVQVDMPGYIPVQSELAVSGETGHRSMVVALREQIRATELVVAARRAAVNRTESTTVFGDTFQHDLPVQGRFYTRVLTLASGAQDGDGEGDAEGLASRDFAAVVGGVHGAGNLEVLSSLGYVGDPADVIASTESYDAVSDNPFHVTVDEPLSTFSADVDTASYSNVRRYLRGGARPPRDAVRIEELINYFDYEHARPKGSDPFGITVEVADCPWNPSNRLARITLAARREDRSSYPGSNLVFLLDVSGSMNDPAKLPLLKRALGLLADQLDGRDTVAMVTYAGASGLVLPPTPGSDRTTIAEALGRLDAGGSTAGAAGLTLAYEQARRGFIPGGVNRVILATDGDFNVGVTSHDRLLEIVKKDADSGIFLTALGFGMGNLKDDRLEQLADRGNGNYAYIDDLSEARKVLVEEIGGTLVTVAKDVKFQVEFNPAEVAAYRLIGYSNRLLAHRDFNDDTRDAGDVGAGHTVTVLYELVPASCGSGGGEPPALRPEVDALRYSDPGRPTEVAGSGELFTLKVRFKKPSASTSELRVYPVSDDGLSLGAASDDFRFAAAVAAFGMRLRDNPAVADFAWDDIRTLAAGSRGVDEHGHRSGFVGIVDAASAVADPTPTPSSSP